METANNTAMHVTETKTLCSSLTCPKSKSEDLTKDQEEELLCSNNEDGDEEDALSDDSMRLRLSDDEAEIDEPFASGDVTKKKTIQEASKMELGSDVPATDTSEQISALTIEKLPNGSCDVEKNEIPVYEVDQKSNDQFAEDTVPETSGFYHASDDSTVCNENSSQMSQMDVKSTETPSATNMPANNGKFLGYFGEYSNRAHHVSQSRNCYSESKQFASDPYGSRYYNKNSYFGGGRESGRAYNTYYKESSSHDENSDEKYWARSQSPSNVLSNKSVTAQTTGVSSQPIKLENAQTAEVSSQPIKSEGPTETLASDNVVLSKVKIESDEAIEIYEPVESEKINKLSNNDNVETATNIVDSFDSEKISENADSGHKSPTDDFNINDKSNASVGSESDEDNVSNSSAATLVPDKSNDIVGEPLIKDEDDVCAEIESNSESPKNLDPEIEEADKDSITVTVEADKDLSPVTVEADINLSPVTVEAEKDLSPVTVEADKDLPPVTAEADKDLPPVTMEADKDLSPVTVEVDKDLPPVTMEADKDLPPVTMEADKDLPPVTMEADKDLPPVTVEADKDLSSETDKADKDTELVDENVALEKSDEDRPNEMVANDNCASQIISMEKVVSIHEMEVVDDEETASNDSSLERAEEELAAELEKCNNPKEDDNKESEKDEPKKSESPKPELLNEEKKTDEEDTILVSEDDGKQSNVVELEQTPIEPSIDATSDSSETNERAVVLGDKENITEPKITDTESNIAVLPNETTTSEEAADFEGKNVRITNGSLKRRSKESLDEMELCKRMRIRRKKNGTNELIGEDDSVEISLTKETDVINSKDNNASTVVDTVTNSIAESKSSSESDESLISNTVVEYSNIKLHGQGKDSKPKPVENMAKNDKTDDCEVIEVPAKRKHRRNLRLLQATPEEPNCQENIPEKENVRQKRRTAKNAEEIIRAKCLDHSDSESNESIENLIAYNKTSNSLRPASPPTLKRDYAEEDEKFEHSTLKKLKQDIESNGNVLMKSEALNADKTQTLAHVRKFFRRDGNGRIAKLKQEELEELLIQKVVETITMRDEIGRLREQAKMSERNQEATRVRCQQLAKQIKDFEMVLNRYESDRRSNPEKTVVPIKINRSVGLQVNFITDHGIQNLRHLGQIQKVTPPIVNGTSTPQQSEQSPSGVPPPRRTIKVRSPRQPEQPIVAPVAPPAPTPVHSQPIVSNITPPALVVTKNITDSRTPVMATVHQPTIPQPIAPKPAILVNGPIASQPIRQQTAIQVSKPKNNDLIDLTEEEDKTKTNALPKKAVLTTAITEASPNVSNVQKIAPRYHTVIQTLPGNMALTAQSGIRVVQPSSQPTPTALVNNMSAPRLAYIVPSGMGSTRQVVVTSTPTPIRPSPTIRTSFPLSGTITNGTVRMIHMNSTATIQVYKHPAALPECINAPSNPTWKLPPPAPSLKISKVANGIVLSWNMVLSDKYAEIASYQLYAYQEVSGIAPSASLWKKVGDVRALPLPMACTLTQFSEGNNYYFAVRAVDKHSRLGLYSQPGNISL